MKKRILHFIFGIILCLGTSAQELKVKSFSLSATDISAQTQPRKDLNDEPCALIKVQLVGDILDVEGNVIKPLVKKGNETWVYMTHGSQQMKVLTKDYLPIMVNFSNFGINQVEKNKTYVLILSKPGGGVEAVMQQCQSLIIKYSPSTATVLVDNLKSATYRVSWEFTCKTTKILLLYIFLGHNRNVVNTKFPYPIKRLEVIRRFNQKSMAFNQSLS